MSKKIGIVIQRYGLDIVGGSEYLCRQIAERLAKTYQVDVLTTCAKDYITWANEYSVGKSRVNGVNIIRFANEKERNLAEFNKYSEWIYNNSHSVEDELRWLEMQGPVCPELINYIREQSSNYNIMIFFTYLYYPTYYGIKECQSKIILVPTAHNEPAIKLDIYKEIFSKANAIIFNTSSERNLAVNLFDLDNKIILIIGTGVRIPSKLDKRIFKKKNGLEKDYIVYGGRINVGKGCDELINYFLKYKMRNLDYPYLILFGKLEMELPATTDVIYLGFISEQEKDEVYAGARVLVVPSAYESLSLILLEGFACGTPALVNSASPVLVDHCIQSKAGLYYANYDEFEYMLSLLLQDNQLRNIMSKNAIRYVKNNFNWSKVINEFTALIEQIS